MDLRTFVIIAAGCMCIVTTGFAATADRRDRPPASYSIPLIKKDCATCHLPTSTEKVGALRKKRSDLCLDCHRDRKAPAEHKVDIVPAREVKGLPLTDGMITCFTCHDPHKNTHGKMLRMRENALCLACHPL